MGSITALGSVRSTSNDSIPRPSQSVLESPPVTRRRTPVSVEELQSAQRQVQLQSLPAAEAADHAAPKVQPLRPTGASQGVVGSLSRRKPISISEPTLHQRQQAFVLGDRAPRLQPAPVSLQIVKNPSLAQEVRKDEVFSKLSDLDGSGRGVVCGAGVGSGYSGELGVGVQVQPGAGGININTLRARGRACVGAQAGAGARSKSRAKKLTPKSSSCSRSQLAERARQLAGQRAAGIAPAAKGFSPAYHVAVAYEHCLGAYRGRRAMKYLRGDVTPKTPNYGSWEAAAQCADSLGIDYLTYVRAQFWFFEKWFSRAAKPFELRPSNKPDAKVPAQERAKAYLAMVERGEIQDGHDVCAKAQAAQPIASSVRANHSESSLRYLSRVYELSVEDVFRTFAVGPIAAGFFDPNWLSKHPVWRALRAAGEL